MCGALGLGSDGDDMDEGDESKPVVAEASDEDVGLLVEGGGAVLRTAMGMVVGSTSRPPRRCSRGQYDQEAGIVSSKVRSTYVNEKLFEHARRFWGILMPRRPSRCVPPVHGKLGRL